MKPADYLPKFQAIAKKLNSTVPGKTSLEASAYTWLDSVAIKLLKKTWANEQPGKNKYRPSVFFSVWITDKSIKEEKIFYNIHALKLRELTGYRIASRDFAANFRKAFKPFEHEWPNLSTAFGPLTLMEGYAKLNIDNYEEIILHLVKHFLKIEFIIDALLKERKIILKSS